MGHVRRHCEYLPSGRRQRNPIPHRRHDRLYDTEVGQAALLAEELDVTLAAAHLLGIDVGTEIGSKRTDELRERWPDEGGTLGRDLTVRGGLRSSDILDRRTELAAALTHGLRPTTR